MRASKENAAKALAIMDLLHFDKGQLDQVEFLAEFLEAARRKLPTEAAYARPRKPKTLPRPAGITR